MIDAASVQSDHNVCKIISNPYLAVKMHKCGYDRGSVHRKDYSQCLSRDVLLRARKLCIYAALLIEKCSQEMIKSDRS